jgi:hypothetical protein
MSPMVGSLSPPGEYEIHFTGLTIAKSLLSVWATGSWRLPPASDRAQSFNHPN